MRYLVLEPVAFLLVVFALVSRAGAQDVDTVQQALDRERIAFFESKIRPVLVERCYKCHSAQSDGVKGGLWLDSRDGVLAGGDSGPAVMPGKPDESLLLEALRYESFEMPPDGKLPEAVIADFRRWIEMGAPDPRSGESGPKSSTRDIDEGARFWSFQPVRKPRLPSIEQPRLARNEIDHFILAKLDEARQSPAAEADRQTLVRRLYIDLVGLPPTLEEQQAFVESNDPQAFERLVDRLLDSPHFGERFGRHWLDVARYADSTGGGTSAILPDAWQYRDYVIRSFNDDKPYDEFIREQIAGDLLPASDVDDRAEKLAATGFLVLGPRNYVTDDELSFRMDGIDEQVDTIGRAFLGMTIGCARCHDHKFDPVPAADYYALAGILGSTTSYELVPGSKNYQWSAVADPRQDPDGALYAEYQTRLGAWAAMREQCKEIEKAIAAARESRLEADDADATEIDAMIAEYQKRLAPLKAAETRLKADIPAKPATIMAVGTAADPGDMPLRIAGNPQRHGHVVPRGFLQVISHGMPSRSAQPAIPPGESGRLQLAEWLTSADNPLTSRVLVNRVWHHLFGRGIVRTVDNFGTTGDAPSHQELLDWLAWRFREDGQSVKRLVRRIVTSRTYRLGVADNDADRRLLRDDPDNQLFARRVRRGLDAETLRDSILAVSGQLDLRGARPSTLARVKNEALYVFDDTARSVYLPRFRNNLLELFQVFDAANPALAVGQRDQTIMPTQALFLMNNEFVVEQSRMAAERLLEQNPLDVDQRIALMYRRTLARRPSEQELDIARTFAAGSQAASRDDQLATWAMLQQTLFECVDFRYVK